MSHDVNWFKMPDGSMVCSLPDKETLTIRAQDELGNTRVIYKRTESPDMPMQDALIAAITG